mgnify:CR=1 FL=1
MVPGADQIDPERHDLHEAASTGGGNGILPEVAFDLDDGEHELGIQPRSSGLVMNRAQEFDPRDRVWKFAPQALRHREQPLSARFLGLERVAVDRLIRDRALQRVASTR